MSLLLDALKKAEKAKQEKSGEKDERAGELELEHQDEPAKTPDGYPEEFGEGRSAVTHQVEPAAESGVAEGFDLELEPSHQPSPQAPAGVSEQKTQRLKKEPLDLTPEESQGLALDLEEFSEALAESSGKFSRLTLEAEMDQGSRQPEETGAHTMPSLKNVQQSLRDFYGGDESSEAPLNQESAVDTEPEDASDGAVTQGSRRAAKGVFEAKRHGMSRRRAWISIAGVLVLVVLAAGAYVWFSVTGVQRITPVVAGSPVRPAPEVPAPLPPAPPAPVSEGLVAAQPPAVKASGPETYAPSAAATPSPETIPQTVPETAPNADNPPQGPAGEPLPPGLVAELKLATTPQPAEPPVEPGAETGPAATPAGQAVTPPPPARPGEPAAAAIPAGAGTGPLVKPVEAVMAPIRIRRKPRTDRLYPTLEAAYGAFMQGDLNTAGERYQRVVKVDPNNRDALLGLAATAIKAGDEERAFALYTRLLELNPQDEVALASLVSLQDSIDPVTRESRLKLLLDRDPGAGYLNFALGNLYAAQSRWAEAQQAFFNAYAADAENGDYAYNLAVALDHLSQGAPALQFYRKALELSERTSVSFDRSGILARIQVLSGPSDDPASL